MCVHVYSIFADMRDFYFHNCKIRSHLNRNILHGSKSIPYDEHDEHEHEHSFQPKSYDMTNRLYIFFCSFVSSSEIKQKKKWNRCWATCLWVKSTFWNYLETLYKVVSLVWFLWSKETAISWLMLRPIYIQNKSYTIRQFRIINELIKWKSQSPQNVRVSCSVACSIWESYF